MERLYIITLLLLLFSVFTGKFKKITSYFSIVVLVILNYGLDNKWDLYNYFIRYDNIMNIDSNRELGFQIIMKIFNFFNVDFATFRCIMIIIGLIIIMLFLKKITNDSSFFLLCYMSYFAFLEGEQIRNFYALIVLICAFKYLFYNDKISNIKYIILILIASSIHSSFIVYLVFLLVKSNVNISKLMTKLIPIMVILMLVLSRYTELQSIILSAFSTEDDSRGLYYSQAISNLGWIAPTAIYIWNLFIVRYCYSLVKGKKQSYELSTYTLKDFKIIKNTNTVPMEYIFERLYMINIIGLVFIPLYMNSLVFYRINRNIIMINLLFICSIYNKQREMRKKSILIFCFSLILIIGYWIFDFKIYNSWEKFHDTYFVERTTNSFK